MAAQWSGWKVDTTSLVVDDLGSLRCLMQGGALQVTAVSGREILRLALSLKFLVCMQFKQSGGTSVVSELSHAVFVFPGLRVSHTRLNHLLQED